MCYCEEDQEILRNLLAQFLFWFPVERLQDENQIFIENMFWPSKLHWFLTDSQYRLILPYFNFKQNKNSDGFFLSLFPTFSIAQWLFKKVSHVDRFYLKSHLDKLGFAVMLMILTLFNTIFLELWSAKHQLQGLRRDTPLFSGGRQKCQQLTPHHFTLRLLKCQICLALNV